MGNEGELIKLYFNNKAQICDLNDKKDGQGIFVSRCPSGFILGPIWSMFYANDLGSSNLYVDDTNGMWQSIEEVIAKLLKCVDDAS